MKIVHVAPNSPYNDNWGYQENLLTKYQQLLGNDVTLLVVNKMHEGGRVVEVEEEEHVLDNGVKVIRCALKRFPSPVITNIISYMPVYSKLTELNPDFIFYHGLISTAIFDVIKFKKKNPECVIVQDNHLDFNIGRNASTPKERILRAYYRLLNRKTIKYVDKVYGVTPWRKTYAEDYFKIPKSKTDVLIMGADDDQMDFEDRCFYRKEIRNKFGIKGDEFLIISGGKIDKKKNIDILMEACSNYKGVKLFVFGEVSQDLEDRFNTIISNSQNIIYLGWIDSKDIYKYYYASDLAYFPGQHSVLWEQACASKIPCVFQKWTGMDHVNNGGNSDFISVVDVENIRSSIKSLCFTDKYYEMLRVAQSDNTDIYLYSNIALKSLECAKK